uniref:Wbp11/ELF5/Saf1 N-terminal domain-containing protein n=1 Tax=Bionectria ochroleuca TaxID=29856 RepID=A0A8H7NJW7_BIOOC
MAGERNYNPVQAQRKAEKARAIKKGKADVQNRKNEKLAQKNPNRIQKQIDDLEAVATNGGKLTKHEEQVLEGLKRDLKAVNKARESLGDRAPTFGRGWNRDRGDSGQGVLGKRRRGDQDASSSDEDVPEDVQRIPMPRDTPPPIPKEVLDEWYAKRRARRNAENPEKQKENNESASKQETPAVESKTVYSAAPVSRDLRKEAVAAFVPTAVKMKMDKGKGQGGLIEPEEADKLEREGYLKLKSDQTSGPVSGEADTPPRPLTVTMEEVEDEEA